MFFHFFSLTVDDGLLLVIIMLPSHEQEICGNDGLIDLKSLFKQEQFSDDEDDVVPRLLVLYSENPVEEWFHIHGIHFDIIELVASNSSGNNVFSQCFNVADLNESRHCGSNSTIENTTKMFQTQVYAGGIVLHFGQSSRPDSLVTTASHTYGTVWGCSRALCMFFSDMAIPRPHESLDLKSHFNFVDFSGLTVVELGAGTGCAGIFIAKFWPSSKVILTDVAPALPLIASNALLNNCDNVQITELNFGDEIVSAVKQLTDSIIDAVVCSDLLFSHLSEPYYWDELAISLARVLCANEGVCTSGVVVWFMFQERWGSRDVSPFFSALQSEFLHQELYSMGGKLACGRQLVISEINHSALHIEDRGKTDVDVDYYPMRLIRISTCSEF